MIHAHPTAKQHAARLAALLQSSPAYPWDMPEHVQEAKAELQSIAFAFGGGDIRNMPMNVAMLYVLALLIAS